jgi:ammonia channel protein AmtB
MVEEIQGMKFSADALFLMIGAVMIFSMHAGFAFLEAGTVRVKNQINAFVKILTDWSVSTILYFCIGFPIAYGINFFTGADTLVNMVNGGVVDGARGFDLLHCFFCGLYTSYYFWRYCGTGQILATGSCWGCFCCICISAFRICYLGTYTIFPGVVKRVVRCRVS